MVNSNFSKLKIKNCKFVINSNLVLKSLKSSFGKLNISKLKTCDKLKWANYFDATAVLPMRFLCFNHFRALRAFFVYFFGASRRVFLFLALRPPWSAAVS